MSVGIRVTCDAEGCKRHFDVDALAEGIRVTAYSPPPVRDGKVGVYVDGGVAAPEGWGARGGRILCRDHST